MSMNNKRIELINTILEDDKAELKEEETLHQLLKEYVSKDAIAFLMKPFDKYPFILLNLILSCLASIQAPVIMMSQNRQEQKDRLRAINDYKVNLKSEIIVEDLHIKLDNIIENQNNIMTRLNELEYKNSNSNINHSAGLGKE